MKRVSLEAIKQVRQTRDIFKRTIRRKGEALMQSPPTRINKVTLP